MKIQNFQLNYLKDNVKSQEFKKKRTEGNCTSEPQD